MRQFLPFKALLCLALLQIVPGTLLAAGPPCRPCVGVAVDRPGLASRSLADVPVLEKEERLFVRYRVPMTEDVKEAAAQARELAEVGATPWVAVVFEAPAPLLEDLGPLEEELGRMEELARTTPENCHFQILWEPPTAPEGSDRTAQYAFLLKRASVVLVGVRPDIPVITAPFSGAVEHLKELYLHEIEAYIDGIAVAPGSDDELHLALTTLDELDPGRPVVLDSLPAPGTPEEMLPGAARWASAGFSVILFDTPEPSTEVMAPLKIVAREFAGDLSFDPYSAPTGGAGAWSFVRGDDLSLRVVAQAEEPGKSLRLVFPDPLLRRPEMVDLETGEEKALFGFLRTQEGVELTVEPPGQVLLLRLERPTAEELDGLADRITVATDRSLPVEEILRRLQAFEDAQARRLHHYQSFASLNLAFEAAGVSTVEATFEGDFFFRQGEGFDWAWQTFYLNGVRYRGKKLPELPLIQPEKAAALPLEIHFTRQYRYRLKGEERIGDRSCWVVGFQPVDPVEAAEQKLHSGTVWVDQEIFARVKTRAIQLGLEGEVLSSEETATYSPVDGAGEPAPWARESYFLPLQVVRRQLVSILNAAILVDSRTLLSQVEINGDQYQERLDLAHASDVTMVRDTPEGLRYLVKEEGSDERVAKEGYDKNKLFLAGGVFYEKALDYPLPLVGVDYFSFDFRDRDQQFNLFFGGALLVVSLADPQLGNTRFDLGGHAFGIAVPFTDSVYREGEEILEEEVKVLPASLTLSLGHPVGDYSRVGLTYGLRYWRFRRGEEMSPEFTVPTTHFSHSFGMEGRFTRFGYRLSVSASYNLRSQWEAWGYPDNPADISADRDFLRWDASLAKVWYFQRFQKLGLSVEYLGGQDMDRFSKYDFGFFGDATVHGYRTGRVRAEEGWGTHVRYGLGVGDALRVELVGDAVWATDEEAGLDQELLCGVGLVGNLPGPWGTFLRFDVGFPVVGPEDGFVAYLVFLKLFP